MDKSPKRLRFEKVASNRVQKVIDYLRLLQNCTNRNNYEYTEADVERMFNEIQRSLKETKEAYAKEIGKLKKTEFTFD